MRLCLPKNNNLGRGNIMRCLLSAVVAGALLCAPAVANAQSGADYPSRPIRLVVGFAPGGATDVVARMLTGALGTELGQTVIVENMPGASGLVAWRAVAGANPDGYTLLMAENAIAIRPGFKDMQPPFDPVT
jgi:tripartite-type tricarboxylate transporter receptor subunit TctC